MKLLQFCIYAVSILIIPAEAQYTWLESYDSSQSISSRINPPDDYVRLETVENSFANWLQNLPLKKGDQPIVYYNGSRKFNQLANHAVLDIDTGAKDLQQCADAVIRLRSEYYYAQGKYDSIAYNFTSGDRFRYKDWLAGKTAVVSSNDVSWINKPKRENSRSSFRKYLDIVFNYAGSYSLSKELIKVEYLSEMRIGDIFIEGGFPGHAIIIIDMAVKTDSGEKVFIMAQSYMPAQSIHVIKNPLNWSLSPWYDLDFGDSLYTLEWIFSKDELMRFK